MFQFVEEELKIPTKYNLKCHKVMKKPREWSAEEKDLMKSADRALAVIYLSLDSDMFLNIEECNTAKETWDQLYILYESNGEQKRDKVCLLRHNFETFKQKDRESIDAIYSYNTPKRVKS